MRTPIRRKAFPAAALTMVVSLVLASCGDDAEGDDAQGADGQGGGESTTALVATFDGGLYVIDEESLEVTETVELDGFNRINPAGDEQHVMVSTDSGFEVLDTAAGELTGTEFAGEEPGHVVHHAGKTALFTDGTGEVAVFEPEELAGGDPETRDYTAAEPHHGVAIELSNGELVSTLGDEESVDGIEVLDADNEQIATFEDCPGVHGEATAADEVVVIGCEDGAVIYHDGQFTKVDSPDDYGRIGNQAGSEESPVLLGDYKVDEEAELERPERVSLIDTRSGELELVDIGASYSFRSLQRGPHGEALVLGTDGAIHVIDPEEAEVTESIDVVDEWREPLDWQDPRPTLYVRGHTAYVTDPDAKTLHAVDIESGERQASAELPEEPNELTGVATDDEH